ncbi:MAG: Trm112 family protein [Actinomycetota bacterium]
MTSVLDPRLLDILACPEDKGPLWFIADEDRLYNPRLKRSYDVRDGIPVMLVDEATTVSDDEHQRIVARIAAENITPTFTAE